jgi:hypothetical protein
MFRTVACDIHFEYQVWLRFGHGIRFQEDILDVERGQPRGINIDYGGMSDSYFG